MKKYNLSSPFSFQSGIQYNTPSGSGPGPVNVDKLIRLSSLNPLIIDRIQFNCLFNFLYESGMNTEGVSSGYVSFTNYFLNPPLVFTQMIASNNNIYYVNIYQVTTRGFYYTKLYHGQYTTFQSGCFSDKEYFITSPIQFAISESFYWIALNTAIPPNVYNIQFGTISFTDSTLNRVRFPSNFSTPPLIFTQPIDVQLNMISSIQITQYNQFEFDYSINIISTTDIIRTNAPCTFHWWALDPSYFVGGINTTNRSFDTQIFELAANPIVITQMIATTPNYMYKCNIHDVTSEQFKWNKFYMFNSEHTICDEKGAAYSELSSADLENFFWIVLPPSTTSLLFPITKSLPLNSSLIHLPSSVPSTTFSYDAGLSSLNRSTGTIDFSFTFSTIPVIFTQIINPTSNHLYYVNIYDVTTKGFSFIKLLNSQNNFDDGSKELGRIVTYSTSVEFSVLEPFYWVAFDPSFKSSPSFFQTGTIDVNDSTTQQFLFPIPLQNSSPILFTQPIISNPNDLFTIFSIQISSYDAKHFSYYINLFASGTYIQQNAPCKFNWCALDPTYFSSGKNTTQNSSGTQLLGQSNNPIIITQMIATNQNNMYKCNIYNITPNQFNWIKYYLSQTHIINFDKSYYTTNVIRTNTASIEPFFWADFSVSFPSPSQFQSIEHRKLSDQKKSSTQKKSTTTRFFQRSPFQSVTQESTAIFYETGSTLGGVSCGYVSFTNVFENPPLIFTQILSSTPSSMFYVNVYDVTTEGFSYIKLCHENAFYKEEGGTTKTAVNFTTSVLFNTSESFYWLALDTSSSNLPSTIQGGTLTFAEPMSNSVTFLKPFDEPPILLTQALSNNIDWIFSIQITSYDQNRFSYHINSTQYNGLIQKSVPCKFNWCALDTTYFVGGINTSTISYGNQSFDAGSLSNQIIITQMISDNANNMFKCNIHSVTSDNDQAQFKWNKFYMTELKNAGYPYVALSPAGLESFFWLVWSDQH